MSSKIETLGKAREVAKRVKKSVSVPDEDLLPAQRVPEPLKIEAVRIDGLYESVTKVNKAMPKMVDAMLEEFFATKRAVRRDKDGEVVEEREIPRASLDARRRIFETLAKFALTDKRLEKGMGLLRDAAEKGGGSVNISNLNVLQLRELPHGAVDKELERRLEVEDEEA